MSDTVQKLTDALSSRDFKVVEDLWLDLLEMPSIPAEELERLLRPLTTSPNDGKRALELALAIAPELLRAERYAEALPLLRAVAPAAAGNEEVRVGLITCYRHLRSDAPHLAASLDRSGLLAGEDLAAATDTLERLLSYRQGDYFYHATGWGVGAVVDFDPLALRATIDFEHKPGHLVPLETIETIFVRLQPDSFLVLRRTDPARLAQIAQDDPARLVRMVLEAMDRPVSARGLRDLVVGHAITADGWSKWWSAARAALKREPYVAITKGSNPVLTLRAKALTYEEEIDRRFAAMKDLHHLTQALAEYAEHKAQDAAPEAFLLPAARTIAHRIPEETDPGPAFEAALLLSRLQIDVGEFPTPEQIVEGHKEHAIALLNGLTANGTRSRVFGMLRDRVADWPALCYQVLLAGPESLWDAAAAELPPDGPAPSIAGLVDELAAEPRKHLALFAWVCRNLLLERWKAHRTLAEVFMLLLTQCDILARRKALQKGEWTVFDQGEALTQIRQAMRVGDLAYFDQMLQLISETEASRILFRIRQSSGLPDHFAHVLEQKTLRRFPKLLAEEEHKSETPEIDYLYNTSDAIARRRKEHDHILHVLIPRNSDDIAKAKAMGDLSDNADFRAAIQEQHVLNARIIEMGEELQRARAIEPSMVSRSEVSIGARVVVEDTATGQRHTYAILGPWDSDSEHGIIAYMAPLAKALVRHRVGDEVIFSHAGESATYRVLEIGTALDPGSAPIHNP